MAKTRLKINALNYYVNNDSALQATLELLENNPHAAVGNEIRKHHGEVREGCRRKGYRNTLANIGPVRSGFRANVVFTKDSLKTHGEGTLFGCHAAAPERIAPERAFHYSAFVGPFGPSVVVALHYHAGISGQDAEEVQRAHRASQMSTRLIHIIKFFRAMGYDVFVLGDGNQKPGTRIINGLGPVQALRRAGLTVEQHGLELVAYPDTVKLVKQQIIAKIETDSDHVGTRNFFERA